MKTIIAVAIPRKLSGEIVRLRPVRFSDRRFICAMFRDAAVVGASGRYLPPGCSWLSLWWWMRKTFSPAWCIEHDAGPVGLIGVYNLCLGESAEMTLVIAEKRDSRQGYGTAAFRLVASAFSSCHAVDRIFVRTRTDNDAAVSFWKKLGFAEEAQSRGARVLSLEMENFAPEGRSPVL